jgi:hypothetical protein
LGGVGPLLGHTVPGIPQVSGGAFFVSWGVQVYFYFMKVSVPLAAIYIGFNLGER